MKYTNGTDIKTKREIDALYPNKSLPKTPGNWDIPGGPWTIYTPPPTAPTAAQLREQKANEIRQQADLLYLEPVTAPQGGVWNGGFVSAVAISQATELAKFSGLTSVTLFDAENTAWPVDFLQAKQIAAAIGADYQTKFAAKQAAMRALADIPDAAEDAAEQIAAINLTDFLPT